MSATRFKPGLSGRRCMPLRQWPEADRLAWQRAVEQSHPLDAPVRASELRPASQMAMIRYYGQFLGWLSEQNELDAAMKPASRMTPDRLGRYLQQRRQEASPNSVFGQLRMLSMAMNCLAPGQDWHWIARHPAGPKRREAAAARQTIKLFDPQILARRLFAELEDMEGHARDLSAAVRRRNLLIVGTALFTAIRFGNLRGIRLKQNLLRRSDGWELLFAGSETKTKRDLVVRLPPRFARHLEHYLADDRPLLLMQGNTPVDALWVSEVGRHLSEPAMRLGFCNITVELLGRAINPHAVRHVAATTLLTLDPTAVEVAAAALGHDGTKSLDEYYDQSGMKGAQSVWRDLTEKLRRSGSDG